MDPRIGGAEDPAKRGENGAGGGTAPMMERTEERRWDEHNWHLLGLL